MAQTTKSDWSGVYKFDNHYGLFDKFGSCVGTAHQHPDGRWRWQLDRIDQIVHQEGISETFDDVRKAVGEICPSTTGATVVHAGHRVQPVSENTSW